MNVLQVNTVDVRGGAALTAYALKSELKRMGLGSRMLVGRKMSDDPDVYSLRGRENVCGRLIRSPLRLTRQVAERVFGLQYVFQTRAKSILDMDVVRWADVIHLHNAHGGYLNLWAAAGLAQTKPLVWTLHDMWALTGHCAHSLECERWKIGCGRCPHRDVYPAISMDTSRILWRLKARSFRGSRFVVAVPSRWLKEKVRESILSHMPVRLIANAVDSDVFHRRDCSQMRAALGLPSDGFIVAFTAEYGMKNPFKGFSYLLDALGSVRSSSGKRPFLVVIGDENAVSPEDFGFEGRCVGRVADPSRMADFYGAADVFVLPSIAENSPLTVLEALACGTAVVAFDVGGVPELIVHGETGYVAAYRNARDLATGISFLANLDEPARRAMRARCAASISPAHTLGAQADTYLRAYEDAVNLAAAMA